MIFRSKILLVLGGSSLLLAAAPAAPAAATVSTRAESSLLRAVNSTRRAHGLRALRVDPTLVRAARSHSADMLRNGFFAHGAFRSRMLAFRVRGPVVGENLAWGSGAYARARAIVGEWLRSPEHRANLLRPGFTRIGIGASLGSFLGNGGATVVTADFAGS